MCLPISGAVTGEENKRPTHLSQDLPEDLEWKIIYVGSAESEEFDQVLDTVYVGPVPEGRHMFVFQVMREFMESSQ